MTKEESQLSTEAQEALKSAELGGLKKKLNAASWSDHMEDLMKSWGEKAAGLRWMHNQSAGSWKGFSDKLTISSIVLTTVGGAAAFGGSNSSSPELMYALGGVGIVSSLVQSIKKFYQAEEKQADHAAIAKQFGSYYRAMTLELGMGREDRRPADEIAAWASKEYDRMQQDAPNISGPVISRFRKTFSDASSIPDVAESHFVIKVQGRVGAIDVDDIDV